MKKNRSTYVVCSRVGAGTSCLPALFVARRRHHKMIAPRLPSNRDATNDWPAMRLGRQGRKPRVEL